MKRFADRVALDARSLAVCRILFATLLLWDLAQRAGDVRALYTDDGVLPRAAYALLDWDFSWSLHRLGGSAPFELALFALAAVAAVGLLVGYRTFWMTLACWVLTVSLHARNPLLRDGQDDIARVLLFWALFLPWGAAGSLDARAGRPAHPLQESGTRVASVGAAAFVLQLMVTYWVSGVGKLLSPWWRAGDGIFYALHVGRYQTALGQWLSDAPGTRALSYAVILLECLGPVAWILLRRNAWRMAVVAAFLALHLSFLLCMRLGAFPLFCMAAWSALLPAELWERLGWHSSTSPRVSAPSPRLGRAVGWTLAALGCVVLWCNLLYLLPGAALPRWPQRVAEVFGLQQYWVLFSPSHSSPFALSDGWWVIPAVLQDGQQVDLQRGGGPVDWERPPLVSHSFGSARWRHYFANAANLLLPFPPNSTQYRTLEKSRAAFAHWLCREWNAGHPPGQRVNYVSLFLMRYRFDRPNESARRELLYQDACLADSP